MGLRGSKLTKNTLSNLQRGRAAPPKAALAPGSDQGYRFREQNLRVHVVPRFKSLRDFILAKKLYSTFTS